MHPIKTVFCRGFQAVRRVLIVTDGFLYLNGMLGPLKKALTNAGIGYTVYDKATPNPTVLNVELARDPGGGYFRTEADGCTGAGTALL